MTLREWEDAAGHTHLAIARIVSFKRPFVLAHRQ